FPCCHTSPRTSCAFSFLSLSRHPTSPLFPYTTLFRSNSSWRRPTCAATWACVLVSASPRLRIPRHTVKGWPQTRRCAHEHACPRSEEHTSELQSPCNLVCRLLLEKKKNKK